MNPKFVFFGTPEYAAIILEKLIKAGFVPQAVVCNPDRPVGRKKIITPPPVKQLIINQESRIKNQVKILQPENLGKQFLDSLFLIHDSFDFFIVAAYAKIIPKEIWKAPRLGTIGVHPSLLPQYRGPSPVQSAILAGEKKTGITLFILDEKLDHGSVITKAEIGISKSDTFQSLRDKLAELGGDLLIETLPKFIKGEITPLPQEESQATYTKKFRTEDGYIEPLDLEKAQGSTGSPQETRRLAIEIERKVRALNPEPGVWTFLTAELCSLIRANGSLRKKEGKRMKILGAELTVDGKLKLKKIQIEGEKPKSISKLD